MTESGDDELVEDYGHGKIVRETDGAGDGTYHFVVPLEGRMKSFENPDKARLYADVYDALGGFREEKTGERGAPPAVAQAGENYLIAYYVSQPTMSVQWAAGQFGISEDQVRDVTRMIQEKADEKRAGEDVE